ncbi:MAG: DNA polymerase IV [Parvularculaceae bacterium]
MICRGCGAIGVELGAGQCPHCGSRRITAHEELFSLSVAHVDCDAFYAAVEKRDDPSLCDRPVIVGGGTRGVVTTACYVARTYGVHSAMPMFKALKACPDAVVLRPDFAKYTAAAHEVREMMHAVTPLVEAVSIDEAFLDLAGTERVHNMPPAATLGKLQRDIEHELGITVSIGLSFNKFLAKTASDFDKPNGFTAIGKAEATSVLAGMPVRAIWGVGSKLAAKLNADGVFLVADIQRMEASTLASRYGEMGLRLFDLARGQNFRHVKSEHVAKSISAETTFNKDISNIAELERSLWPLCEKVAGRMKAKSVAARVANLKLKMADFKTQTKRQLMDQPSNLARSLFDQCSRMLHETPHGRSYRLIGVGYSDLISADGLNQHQLFENPYTRFQKEEDAIDRIRQKFGEGSISLGRNAEIKNRNTSEEDKHE